VNLSKWCTQGFPSRGSHPVGPLQNVPSRGTPPLDPLQEFPPRSHYVGSPPGCPI
jgi:hypothetical protein